MIFLRGTAETAFTPHNAPPRAARALRRVPLLRALAFFSDFRTSRGHPSPRSDGLPSVFCCFEPKVEMFRLHFVPLNMTCGNVRRTPLLSFRVIRNTPLCHSERSVASATRSRRISSFCHSDPKVEMFRLHFVPLNMTFELALLPFHLRSPTVPFFSTQTYQIDLGEDRFGSRLIYPPFPPKTWGGGEPYKNFN